MFAVQHVRQAEERRRLVCEAQVSFEISEICEIGWLQVCDCQEP